MALDGAGNLLIADAGNNRVRKVDTTGTITTLAGTGENGYSGDGGAPGLAMLNFPWGLTTDAAGRIYIADRVNSRVRMVSTGVLAPSLAANSAANSASLSKTLAPGAIVSIAGANFAFSSLSASSVPLPTVLGNTSVTFNGIAAPLFFVSSGQIDAQAPFELPAGTTVSIQVSRGGALSAVQTANVAAVSPGIFVVNQATGAAAVLHAANYSLVSANSPARSGESLVIYCTGLGSLQIPVGSGSRAPIAQPSDATINTPAVSIGGLSAKVTYSGLASGLVGLYQITAQMPAGLPAGNQSIQITVLGVASNSATIAAAP